MASDAPAKRTRPLNWTPPKGGARYPQYGLKDSLAWANKLVSKTHLSSQPSDIIYASVVNSKGATAEIKVSALKQFNLLEGSSKGYSATVLAKAIASAPPEEKAALYKKAALSPAVFKSLFETYHGDDVNINKLKQRAADLNVHPEKTERCVAIYVETMQIAGLVSVNGDNVSHKSSSTEEAGTLDLSDNSPDENGSSSKDEAPSTAGDSTPTPFIGGAPRAVFQVNVNLDASLDIDKLEKHLALLKRYGAI